MPKMRERRRYKSNSKISKWHLSRMSIVQAHEFRSSCAHYSHCHPFSVSWFPTLNMVVTMGAVCFIPICVVSGSIFWLLGEFLTIKVYSH